MTAPRWPERIARCCRVLPPGLAWRLGRGLGEAFGGLPLRDPRRAREHLRIAFPDRDAAWIARTARRSFGHFGGAALWTLATLARDPRSLARHLAVEDRRSVLAVGRHHRGAALVALSGHFGNWELLSRLSALLVRLTVIGRKLRSPAAEAFVRHLRTGTGVDLVEQHEGALPILRALRAGRVVAFLIDQDVPSLEGVFVPWFGRAAYTPQGPATLIASSGVAVISAFVYRRGGRWVYHLSPIRRYPRGDDRRDLVRRICADAMAYQERLVRRHPEQWVWWHKRWRTRPEDEGAGWAEGAVKSAPRQ